MKKRYEDYYKFLTEQANYLLNNPEYADNQEIAEVLLEMARHDIRALKSQLKRLVAHCLKINYYGYKTASWEITILNALTEIEENLEDNPSLEASKGKFYKKIYDGAVKLAMRDTKLPKTAFPQSNPWSLDEITDDEWLQNNILNVETRRF